MTRPVEPIPSTVTEIFSHPDAKKLAGRRNMEFVIKIAACLLVAVFLWFGVHALSLTTQHLLADRGITPIDVQPADRSQSPALAASGAPGGAEAAPKGIWGRTQQAIARRAAVEVGDTFHHGMDAWGISDHSWAPGWSRNPDGYVHLGALELFHPSQNYTDYRLEFFGQIENKGLGWVMRGRDKENYYAMKFQVIQPGLRPVIAMVHYPVVDGKQGHRVETPLNIMMHNAPFHVAVAVSGNRFTASIEGQKVDSWTDDAPKMGGVGFFTETSERARLYWMKVTKNDDWLGLICSYLAGDGAREVAEVWGPGIPQAPRQRVPPRAPEAILAESEMGFNDWAGRTMRRRPAKIFEYRRNRAWNS